MPFSDAVRTKLSMDAGGFCSNPDCKAITYIFLPGRIKSGGDAAHIVADNLNGPRGQSPLTPGQRSMESNGVWLCCNCHRKVDILYPHKYLIQTLHEWKMHAQIFAQENQGKQLQAVAWPNARPQVNRPNAASMQGANNFLKFHAPLANALWDLRRQSPAPFQRDILIPEFVEQEISKRTSSPKIGDYWLARGSSTYYCDDQELLDYMHALVDATDSLQRPIGAFTNRERRVNFNQPDTLAQAITIYTDVWNAFGECLRGHETWQF